MDLRSGYTKSTASHQEQSVFIGQPLLMAITQCYNTSPIIIDAHFPHLTCLSSSQVTFKFKLSCNLTLKFTITFKTKLSLQI